MRWKKKDLEKQIEDIEHEELCNPQTNGKMKGIDPVKLNPRIKDEKFCKS